MTKQFKIFLQEKGLSKTILFRVANGLTDQLAAFCAIYSFQKHHKHAKIEIMQQTVPYNDTGSKNHEIFQLAKYPAIEEFFKQKNIVYDRIYDDDVQWTSDNSNIYKKNRRFYWTTRLIRKPCLCYDRKNEKKIFNTIKPMLELPNSLLNKENKEMLDLITSTNSVCVHFRFGDDLKKPIFQNRYNEIFTWYKNKMSLLDNNATFFIFSNSLTYAQTELKDFKLKSSKIIFVNINSEINAPEELNLMRHCKTFILGWGGFGEAAYTLRFQPNAVAYRYVPWKLNFKNKMNNVHLFSKNGSIEYSRYAYNKILPIKWLYLLNKNIFLKRIKKYKYNDLFKD